jgi:DNA-binding NarL/FixJ family response regulator
LLSQHVEVRHIVSLATAGYFGYLLKDRVLDVDDFLEALERVARGGSVLDPEVVGQLVAANRDSGVLAALTEREQEVLSLMAEGLTNAGLPVGSG